MKNKKWLYFLLMFLPLLVTIVMLPSLPKQIPAHYGADSQVTRWGSRYEALILPAFTILFGFFMLALAKYAARQEKGGKNNEKAVTITGLCCLLLFDLMCFYFLYTDFHQVENLSEVPLDLNSLIFCCLGILLIVCGAVMPSVKNNSVIGLRTKWSRINETTWAKSQKFGGISFIISGILIILISFAAKSLLCFLWSMLVLCADLILSIWYSWLMAKKYG